MSYKRIPLDQVLPYPLVIGDPQFCEGYCSQIERILRVVDHEPLAAGHAKSFDLVMALVAAGFALVLVSATEIATSREPGIVARTLAGCSPVRTTYLLRLDAEPSENLERFVELVGAIKTPAPTIRSVPPEDDFDEDTDP